MIRKTDIFMSLATRPLEESTQLPQNEIETSEFPQQQEPTLPKAQHTSKLKEWMNIGYELVVVSLR
ncbi:hypothetical protein M404DRAFT_996384 [Pisolithus tinctorius Marx 270]|uniref:Uncharacterized protein n=1 Tax=Pisolithus tinctorius Marx 270 TaxID=870435 RepID=A0A0C3P7Y2_PISTI|nr:hypothetical protein M404DRAFT_996384 [Pisolithus tinctorius Marx 270]